MNASLALHTAARRYCLDRHAYWSERYWKLIERHGERAADGGSYTPEALATFPRYNVLNAIRVEVERLDANALGPLTEVRTILLLAGEIAENAFTRRPIGSIDAQAMAEERVAFSEYIGALRDADLTCVQPLPYRRVLAASESNDVWSRLESVWGMRRRTYWYPLVDSNVSNVSAFDARAFEKTFPPKRLHELLTSHGIQRAWELREWDPDYELDVLLIDPSYGDGEGYWSSGDMKWIVYASHERSITVGGWLLDQLKAEWPAWPDNEWSYHV